MVNVWNSDEVLLYWHFFQNHKYEHLHFIYDLGWKQGLEKEICSCNTLGAVQTEHIHLFHSATFQLFLNVNMLDWLLHLRFVSFAASCTLLFIFF